MGNESQVTQKGRRLIDNWFAAQKRCEAARLEVTRAELDFSNCSEELSKWLKPDDAKSGETFCVWHGDSLIQVRDEIISIKTRGKIGY